MARAPKRGEKNAVKEFLIEFLINFSLTLVTLFNVVIIPKNLKILPPDMV